MSSRKSTLINWQQQLRDVSVLRERKKVDMAVALKIIEEETKQAEAQARSRAIILSVSQSAKEQVTKAIEGIVTSALGVVFGPEYKFQINFETRRKTVELDFVLMKNGKELDIMNSSGLGVANIIAIALRAAFIVIEKRTRRFMALDEPTAALMQAKQKLAGEVLRMLCEKLGFQILLVTHWPELGAMADKTYYVSQANNKSRVELLEDKEEIYERMTP